MRTLLLSSLLLSAPLSAFPQETRPEIERRRSPIVSVVEQALPAVVSIDVADRRSWGRFQNASGTGVVLFEDGILVTNFHVVAPEGHVADRIRVRFDAAAGGGEFAGEVLSYERSEDLALVKILGEGPFPTVPMSDDEPILGETVIAIGNAVGLSSTVSQGIISGLHRDLPVPERGLHFKQLLQTDAAINFGNSGGPLLDINGELVGINTAVARTAENVGYAIPVARVRWVLEQRLLDPGFNSYLGYELDGDSLDIASVVPDGPADRAGLAVGDHLLAINGREIEDSKSHNLQRVSIAKGESVRIRFERDGRNEERELEAWSVEKGIVQQRLGVTLRPQFLGPYRERYLAIDSVDPDGPAGRIGLARDDVIAAARPIDWNQGIRFEREVDLALLLTRLEPQASLMLEVFRDEDHDGVFERGQGVSELLRGTLKLR